MLVIYQIRCICNDRRYIGQTNDFKSRVRHHKNGLRNNCHFNKHLQEDYNKYGYNNFIYEEIEQVDSSNGKSYDFIMDKYGDILPKDKYFVRKLLKHNGPPYMKKCND